MSQEMSYPALMPYLTVRNTTKMLDFYKNAFGFQFVEEETTRDEKGDPQHVTMSLGQAVIMFGPEGAWGKTTKAPATLGIESPLSLYVYCPDVDAFHQQAVKNGAKSIEAPADMFWGDRMCRVEDIDGYQWSFASRK